MVLGLAHLSLIIAATMAFAPQAALGQQPAPKNTPRSKAAISQNTQKPKTVVRRPCSEYGAGFVRMAGSDTCVRIGGSIDAGVGFSR